jgi:hypothetical protein
MTSLLSTNCAWGQTLPLNSNPNNNTSSLETFYANGTVNNLIPMIDGSFTNDTVTILNDVYLLAGKWEMKVVNSTVTSFDANFSMGKSSDDKFHNYKINNLTGARATSIELVKPIFVNSSNSFLNTSLIADQSILKSNQVQLDDNNTVAFIGRADVSMDNEPRWKQIPIFAGIIDKGMSLYVIPDPSQSNGHFGILSGLVFTLR